MPSGPHNGTAFAPLIAMRAKPWAWAAVEAHACANYLKGRMQWQAYCDAMPSGGVR
jgi:hypothetical protein